MCVVAVLVVAMLFLVLSVVYDTALFVDIKTHFEQAKQIKAERKRKQEQQEELKKDIVRINQYKLHFDTWNFTPIISNIPFKVYELYVICDNEVMIKEMACNTNILKKYFDNSKYIVTNLYISLQNSSVVIEARKNQFYIEK